MGSVKWGDIPCVPVQAVRELWLASIVTRSRKGSRREIKLDCHVFPMPVNNLASWKCNRPFPEQNVVTGGGGGCYHFDWSRIVSIYHFWLDSIFLIPPSFFFYFIISFFSFPSFFSNVSRNFYDHELHLLLFYFLFPFSIFILLVLFCFLIFSHCELYYYGSYFNYPIFLAFFSLLIFFDSIIVSSIIVSYKF